MSDKSTKNETPWRGRGFKKPYQGNNSYPFQEFVDANKSNSLNLNLRQRKLVAGVYDTKSDNMAHANAVNLTTIAENWKTAWTPAQKAAASLLLQAERKEDLIHAGRSAHQITEDTSTELFKSCDYQMAKFLDDKEAVYKYWLDVTGGDVREKVIRKGIMGVNDIFTELHQDYGQAEDRKVGELTNLFNTGKPYGVSELDEQIDIPQYLDEMSALQTRIREKLDPEKRATAQVLTDDAWCKAVELAIPAIYEGCIEKLRENAWLQKTLNIADVDQRNAAFTKRDYKGEVVERTKLREALCQSWQSNVRRWKSRKSYNRTLVSMFQTGVSAQQVANGNRNGGFKGKCYGCGGAHRLADCPNKKNGGKKESEFRRTRKNRENATKANKGKARRSDIPCTYWLKGDCRHGSRCDFNHELKKGSGSGGRSGGARPESRLKQARIDKFVTQAMNTMFKKNKQCPKRDKETASGDDDGSDDGSGNSEHDAKKMRTMLTKLAQNNTTGLFMVLANTNGEFEAVDPADDKNVTLTDVGSGTNDIDGVTAPNVGTGTEDVGTNVGVAFDGVTANGVPRPTTGGLTVRVVSREKIQEIYDSMNGTASHKGDTFAVNPDDNLEDLDDSDGGSEAKVPEVNAVHQDARSKTTARMSTGGTESAWARQEASWAAQRKRKREEEAAKTTPSESPSEASESDSMSDEERERYEEHERKEDEGKKSKTCSNTVSDSELTSQHALMEDLQRSREGAGSSSGKSCKEEATKSSSSKDDDPEGGSSGGSSGKSGKGKSTKNSSSKDAGHEGGSSGGGSSKGVSSTSTNAGSGKGGGAKERSLADKTKSELKIEAFYDKGELAEFIGGDRDKSLEIDKLRNHLAQATDVHYAKIDAIHREYEQRSDSEVENSPPRFNAPECYKDPMQSALTEEDRQMLTDKYGDWWDLDGVHYRVKAHDEQGNPTEFDLVLHHHQWKGGEPLNLYNAKVEVNKANYEKSKPSDQARREMLAKWEMAETDDRYDKFCKEKASALEGSPWSEDDFNDPKSSEYRNKYSWSTRQHHFYGAMLRDNGNGYRGVDVGSPEYTNEYSLFQGEGDLHDLAVWKALQETKYKFAHGGGSWYTLHNLRENMPDDSLSMMLVDNPAQKDENGDKVYQTGDKSWGNEFNRTREHEHLMDFLQHHHGSASKEAQSNCDDRPLDGDFIQFLTTWKAGSGPIDEDLDSVYSRAGVGECVFEGAKDPTPLAKSKATNEEGSSGANKLTNEVDVKMKDCSGGSKPKKMNGDEYKPQFVEAGGKSYEVKAVEDDQISEGESVLQAEYDDVMADLTAQIGDFKVVKALMMREYTKVKVNLSSSKAPSSAITGDGHSAWDYCAGASLSDQDDDFLFVDRRPCAKDSVEIVTATGSGGCEGRGPLVLFLHNTKEFGNILLIDFDGICTPQSENSPVRITSALRMEKMGVVMRMDEPRRDGSGFSVGKSIECLWTGFKCNLVEHDDILFIPTVKKSAKNLKKNKAVIKKYLPLLKEGSTSPIVNLWEIDHRIQKAYAAQIVEQNKPTQGSIRGVAKSYSVSPVPGWSGDPGGKKLPPPGMIPVNVLGKQYTVNPYHGWQEWPDDWQSNETLGNFNAWKEALDEKEIPMPGSLFDEKMEDKPLEVDSCSTKSQLPTIEECAEAYLGKALKRPLEDPKPQVRSVRSRSAEVVDFSSAAASAAGVGTGMATAPSTKSGVTAKVAQTGTEVETEESDLLLALTKGDEGPVIGELRKCTPDEYRLVESKILATSCKGSVLEEEGSSMAMSRSDTAMAETKNKPAVTMLSTLAPTTPINFNCVSYEYSRNEEEAMLQVLRERCLMTVTRSTERATPKLKERTIALIVNVSKLSAKEQARLWHWRLGHCAPDVPIKLSKLNDEGRPLADGIKVTHCLNEDCIVCAKARFKVKPFRPVPPAMRPRMPPYFTLYIDGFGGQSSMGTKSIGIPTDWCNMPTVGGAIGGYSFYDPAGGSIVPLLYKKKSQFPVLLRRFLVSVMAKGFHVHVIIATDTEIVNSGAVEHICAEFDIDLRPPSVGTPEDLGAAEKSVGDLMRLARSFMIGAPHLRPSIWGAAVVWAGVVNEVLPKKFNGGLTPYEFTTGRIPHLRRLCIYVFGTPCEAVTRPKGQRPLTKLDSLTETMSFVGTEGATKILVFLPEASRIYSVSRRKVAPQEGAYIEGNSTTLEALKKKIQIVPDLRDGEEEILIDTVPTIRSLQTPHVDAKSGVEDGNSISNEFVPYKEPHEFVFDTTEATAADELIKALLKQFKVPHVKSQLSQMLNPDLSKATIQSGQAEVLKEKDDVGDRSSRRKKLKEAKALRELEKAEKQELETVKRTAEEAVASVTPLLAPLYKAKAGTRVKIDTKMFDGEVLEGEAKYSDGKPKETYGTVRGKGKRGVLRVLWDGESRPLDSDWRHLKRVLPTDRGATDEARSAFAKVLTTKMFVNKVGYYEDVATAFGESRLNEPLRTLARIEHAVKAVVLKTNAKAKHPEWPRDFAEMLLLQPDWREWLGSILKEHNSWIENEAVEEVDRKDMTPGSKLIRLGELFTRKRDGRPKFRPYVLGNLLRAGIDFVRTFSGTVSATTIKWFMSLMTGLRRLVKSSDVMTGYLAGDQEIDVYVEKPSYWGYVDWPIESLADLRKLMREVLKKDGMKGVKRYLRANQNRSKVLRLNRPVYGLPSAGAEFGMLVVYVMTRILKLVRSDVDPAMYYKTDGQLVCQLGPFAKGIERYTVDEESVAELQKQGAEVLLPYRRDSCWTRSYLVVLTWTDDFPYAGTDQLVKWYEDNAKIHLPLTFEPVCEDFVSIEVKQDMERMLKWLTHSKYCLAMGVKYSEYLKCRRTLKHPMKPATEKFLLSHKPTDEEFNSVSNFPYREVMGTVAFPACHTKIECRGAVSVLSRFMSKWSRPAIEGLLDCMGYMVYSHDLGVCFSYGLDWHGINTPYGFTDSSLNPPTSMGGNNAKMNGACIAANAKKHTLVDTSTTMAELVEAFNASQCLVGIRNMHKEMGITVNAPTTLYCDCDPAIKVVSGDRSMTESSRALDLKIWKLRERQDVQEIDLEWCSTVLQESDINTKSLPLRQFKFLRELLNGYALVMLHYPELKMPEAALTRVELIQMFREYKEAEDKRQEAAAKKKAKL